MGEGTTNEFLLALDLQTFASDEGNGAGTEEGNGEDGTATTPTGADNPGTTAEDETREQKIPYDRFKAKVDEANALKAQVAAFEAKQAQAETDRLEANEEYKTLYEKSLADIQALKQATVEASKKTILTGAGYSEEQTAKLVKLVEGETEDEVKASIQTLKEAFPVTPAYVDPSIDNGVRGKPAPKDSSTLGRSLFERIKGNK